MTTTPSSPPSGAAPPATALHSAVLFAALMVFWLLLSGKYDMHHVGDQYLVACGILSCLGVTWFARRRMGIVDGHSVPLGHLAGALRYFLWLNREIALANWDVFKRIWNPALPIDPCVVTVPFDLRSDFGIALFANSVTLTPGTVTLNVDTASKVIVVHCLTRGAADDLAAGAMHARVKRYVGEAS